MPDLPDVRPGQVWTDNDPRNKGRSFRVVSVHEPDADHSEAYVKVEVLTVSYNVRKKEKGKQRTMKRRRFRPTRNGYKLKTDVSTEDPPAAASYPVEEAKQVDASAVNWGGVDMSAEVSAQVQCYCDGSRDGHLWKTKVSCPAKPADQARAY